MEQQKDQATREQERMMDEYDDRKKTPYKEIEAAVCVPLSDLNKKLFWKVISERGRTDRSWLSAKRRGIPSEEFDSIRIRYEELKREHQSMVNTRNAQRNTGPREKTKKLLA